MSQQRLVAAGALAEVAANQNVIFNWVGAAFSGSATTSTPSYNASVPAGTAVYVIHWLKASSGSGEPPDPVAPSGWTTVATVWGGTGTAGTNTGPVKVVLMRRDTDSAGTEGGTTASFNNPSGSSLILSGLFGVTYTGTLSYVVASGSQASSTTAWSTAMSADPGLLGGDFVLQVLGGTTSNTTNASAESVTVPGCTVGALTERIDTSSAVAFSLRGVLATGVITAGQSTGAATSTATLAAATTGVAGIIAIRQPVNSQVTLVPYPAGIRAGDTLLLGWSGGGTALPTNPAGWTQLANIGNTGSTAVPFILGSIKRATGAEAGSVDVAHQVNVATVGQVLCLANVDAITPTAASTVTSDNTTSLVTAAIGSITPAVKGTTLVALVGGSATGHTASPPAGYTETADRVAGTRDFELAYRLDAPDAASGGVSTTWNTGTEKSTTAHIALRPAPPQNSMLMGA